MKDHKARKPDAHAQVGQFVGYDSESKGYCIYWPDKRSITVQHNVVFNENDTLSSDDTAIIPGNALAKGEKEKIIQAPVTNERCGDNHNISEVQPDHDEHDSPDSEPLNSVPFLSTPDVSAEPLSDPTENAQDVEAKAIKWQGNHQVHISECMKGDPLLRIDVVTFTYSSTDITVCPKC